MTTVRCLGQAVICAAMLSTFAAYAAAARGDRFSLDDYTRLSDIGEPEFSPDGETVVYSVTVANTDRDRQQSDLWRVRWDGSERQALTQTPEFSEWQPAFSPDGRMLAFLADRGDEDATTQVWIMPTTGGEARKLTDFPGGVTDFDWSPDGRRLAVIASDPERAPGSAKPKNPPPIVTDRYYFKQDESDYLGDRRQHLYVYEIAGGRATQLTSGPNDEYLPEWSPDGSLVAYVTKRGDDADRTFNYDIYVMAPEAGSRERRITDFPGGDQDPYLESRLSWSPDGRRIAYLQGGEDRWIYYPPWRLAIVDVATGASRLATRLDRWFYRPRWSPDGRSVLALIEESRIQHLSRIDAKSGKVTPLTRGLRYDYDFAVAANGRIAVLGGDDLHPYAIAALDRGGLRPIADHNEFLRGRQLAAVEPIRFRSADGTEIEGMLTKPVGYVAGQRYPTILRIHGGPVSQFNHEFMADWQLFAANGYAVVAANPRGSSGRGFDFARAIWADWGNKDRDDVIAAVDHAIAIGVADPERLGVGGHSYGSILTNYVIASDRRFKAATSSAGASEFLGMYGHDEYVREYEFELGPPWKDADVYLKLSYPFLHADRITTPTSFYCAQNDFNVPCLGAEQMYQALRSLNVPTQLVVYPGQNHTLKVPSYLRDRLSRYVAWYDRYLGRAGQGGR